MMNSLGIQRLVFPFVRWHGLRAPGPGADPGKSSAGADQFLRHRQSRNRALSRNVQEQPWVEADRDTGGQSVWTRQGQFGVQGVISTFLSNILAGNRIEIWGDGSVVRDYLYVADLASLCVRAAESSLVGAVNAGSGVGRSLNDIIKAVTVVTGKNVECIYKPGRAVDVRARFLISAKCASFLIGNPTQALRKRWLRLGTGCKLCIMVIQYSLITA